ncbi:MAG: acetoacetate decarboxylase family protein [Gammaproteobacteria bacterium]
MARKPAKRQAARSYSMPEISELYGKPPFHYREVNQLLVAFQTDARVLRKLVPTPLTPNKDNAMFVSVADFMCSGFGRYLEMHLFTQATYKRRLVNYSLYLILDNDVAIGAGREIWGFPKKLGRLTLDTTDDVVRTTVERGGINVVEAAVHLAELGSEEDVAGTPEWVARRFIPNVSLSAPPDVDQLTTTTLYDIAIGDVYKGAGTLNFGDSPADRLSDIPIKKVTGGFFFEAQMTLGDGEVLHDYLA